VLLIFLSRREFSTCTISSHCNIANGGGRGPQCLLDLSAISDLLRVQKPNDQHPTLRSYNIITCAWECRTWKEMWSSRGFISRLMPARMAFSISSFSACSKWIPNLQKGWYSLQQKKKPWSQCTKLAVSFHKFFSLILLLSREIRKENGQLQY
jgi:hypothetical protein